MMKIKDETLKIAFSILDKASKDRTNNEKLWLKLHGGITAISDSKKKLELDLKHNWENRGRLFRSNKVKPDYFFKPLTPDNLTVNKIYSCMISNTFKNLSETIRIILEVDLYNKQQRKDDKYKQNFKKIQEIKNFLNIKIPLPVKDIDKTIEALEIRRREWQNKNKKIVFEEIHKKEKFNLINKYKLNSDLGFKEVKKIEAKEVRNALGIGEKENIDFSKLLFETINKDLKEMEGFIYLRRWKVSDGTTWFKIGITNNLFRRESEQNVLPVAAQTLATAKLASMEQARTIEKSIHNVISKYQIKGSNNKELFRLKPNDLASLLDLFKKIDLRNK